MRTLGLWGLRAAAMGAPAERAAPSRLPLAGHRLGPAARQAGGAGAQAEQGAQGQGCSDGNAQEGQLHTGIQQTCTGSAAPSAPRCAAAAPRPSPRHLPGGRREAVVMPTLLAALTEKLLAALPRRTRSEWLASPG